MENFNVAILGCGTVGSGVAKILMDMDAELQERSGKHINLSKIIDLFPAKSAAAYNIPLNLFCGGGKDLTPAEASAYINEIIADTTIDLVVETIGGTSDFLYKVFIDAINSGKNVVSANKAMLAERGSAIFNSANEREVVLGFEAAVCGAIPVIRTISDGFAGDKVVEISGIMNGTSNYILTKMQDDGLDFETALKMAQDAGYAEADPTLDVSGGDAGHKLCLLIKLAYGVEVDYKHLHIEGIQNIKKEDIDFANELGCNIKLICYARKLNGKIYAAVEPMMVKHDNLLSKVGGATNCVKLENKYTGNHMFVGKGAGSLETAGSIVSDIVFAAKYGFSKKMGAEAGFELVDPDNFEFSYNITFSTADYPGITGLVTTAIGDELINIETVSHNRHGSNKTLFSLATMPCTIAQIKRAIARIRAKAPNVLLDEPVIMPILK
jgi:homoserine dehydrogenase